MRRTYTVHEKDASRGRPPREPIMLREGFSLWAFLLGPIWTLWFGMWLVSLALIVLHLGILALPAVGIVADVEAGVVQLGLSILTGLLARDLRRWTLRRRGWALTAVVCADDARQAEWRFFDARAAERAAAAAAGPGPAWGRPGWVG